MYYEKLTVRINEKVVCEQTKTFYMRNCIWSFENKLVKRRSIFKVGGIVVCFPCTEHARKSITLPSHYITL